MPLACALVFAVGSGWRGPDSGQDSGPLPAGFATGVRPAFEQFLELAKKTSQRRRRVGTGVDRLKANSRAICLDLWESHVAAVYCITVAQRVHGCPCSR